MTQVVIKSVITLFVLIFLGFLIGKRGMVKKESIPDFSTLVLSVTMPVTIFCSISQQDSLELAGMIWKVMLMALIYHIGAMLFGMLIVKIMRIPERESGIWIFNFMLCNNGFMGLPLALSIFGSTGMFLMAMANVITNLFIFSVGIKFVTRGCEVSEPISLKKMLVNNINIAVVLGFVFFLGQISLPEAVTDLLGYISDISSGLSMLVIGLSLSRMEIREVFMNRRMFVMVFFRLLVIPMLVIGVFKLLPFEVNEMLYVIILLMAALPSASAQSMIAEQYHANTEDAGRAVFLTTLFSLVTIPVVMAVGL